MIPLTGEIQSPFEDLEREFPHPSLLLHIIEGGEGGEVSVDSDKRFYAYITQERNLSKRTAQSYLHSKKYLERWTGISMQDMTVTEVRRFMRESHYRPASKAHFLAAAKAWRRFEIIEGWKKDDGLLELSAPKVDNEPKESLTLVEAKTVLASCRTPREFRSVWVPLYQGVRVSENAALFPSAFMVEDGIDIIKFWSSKARKTRKVPLHPEIAERKDFLLITTAYGTLKNICRSLSDRTGIYFSPHTLRRTFGVVLNKHFEVPREVCGALMGHSPGSITEGHYIPVRWEEQVAAMYRLQY